VAELAPRWWAWPPLELSGGTRGGGPAGAPPPAEPPSPPRAPATEEEEPPAAEPAAEVLPVGTAVWYAARSRLTYDLGEFDL